MHLDWSSIVQYVISGAIVSWPVFIAGLWFSHRRVRRHVDRVTGQQTADVRQITDDQTGVLLRQLGREYHQHGPGEGEGQPASGT